ncbi:MAG: efflux RND transporter periplasmic adaptor subunit [Flavobacteriaceae bacterium]|nr:efflux RND transporter periplasmic adaptor subunit [Flavobacteriaceae bacterium]
MRTSIITLLLIYLITSCNEKAEVSSDIQTLQTQKTSLKNQIDSLSAQLKVVETQLSKLDPQKKLTLISTIPVELKNFKHFVEIQGEVKADKNIELKPELGGTIKAIYVKEGSRVSAGQTIMQLDDSTIQNSISELNTQLNLAKTTYERQKRLWDQKIGSEMQYLQAKTQKESLENSLNSLYTQARKMKIKAPFSGIVDEIFPNKGELTSPQTAVARLMNLNQVYLEAELTERYLPVVKIGSEAILNFPSIQVEISSKISQISNYINPDNRSFKVKLDIPNKDRKIKPNLLADLKIVDFNKEGVCIPSTLVQQDQNGQDFVYVVETENNEKKAIKKLITIEKEYKNEAFIAQGLTGNDILISQGARLVKNGEIVTTN